MIISVHILLLEWLVNVIAWFNHIILFHAFKNFHTLCMLLSSWHNFSIFHLYFLKDLSISVLITDAWFVFPQKMVLKDYSKSGMMFWKCPLPCLIWSLLQTNQILNKELVNSRSLFWELSFICLTDLTPNPWKMERNDASRHDFFF